MHPFDPLLFDDIIFDTTATAEVSIQGRYRNTRHTNGEYSKKNTNGEYSVKNVIGHWSAST